MSVSTFNMAEAQMLNNKTIFSNIQKETEKMAILSGFMHTHTHTQIMLDLKYNFIQLVVNMLKRTLKVYEKKTFLLFVFFLRKTYLICHLRLQKWLECQALNTQESLYLVIKIQKKSSK